MHTGSGFITDVSKQVIDRYPNDLHLVTVVVPAKRSLRFFRNSFTWQLAQQGRAAILPEMITLSDLTARLSPYTVLTPLELSFHFYKVYTAMETEPEPFEKFYTWAPALLADFNEIDNYLVSPPHLFRDLKNIKEIEEWSFLNSEWSKGQEKLNQFWEKIPGYYKALNEYLAKHKLAYNGMSNKYIAENAGKVFAALDKRHYVFAGFNALTNCEKTIMQHLNVLYDAQMFFDADGYYVDHEFHEAGLFIRSFDEVFKSNFHIVDAQCLLQEEKQMFFYECSGEALQCNKLVKLLEKEEKHELERSAIVLCNEQLLPVLVGEFPNELLRVNVTMGWPLRFTNINDFFQALIEIHIALQRSRQYVPYEQVRHFLDITASVFPVEQKEKIPETVNYTQLLEFFSGHEIQSLLEHKGDDILFFVERAKTFLYNRLKGTIEEELQTEVYAHFFEVFSKFSTLPGFKENIKSWYLFKRFFQAFTRQYPLAFLGEPMSGVQVMGMLETRGLDFDKVFILSGNEGFLPAQQTSSSFIPYDLRQFVKLPGKAEQDAVFAYYFYRLIQRAREVHVFYNGQSELLMQAEKSRYLLQIEKELVERNKGLQLTKSYVSHKTSAVEQQPYPAKTEFYFRLLNEYASRGFSASMLSTFVNCPLDFYFKYILGFKEEKDPQTIDESEVGNIIHDIFQREFIALEGKKIELHHLQAIHENTDAVMAAVVHEKYQRYEFASGENYLALQMVRKMVQSFLQQQTRAVGQNSIVGKTLIGTERKLETLLTLGSGRQVKIKGTLDLLLVDGNNNYFVYDFKTGKTSEDDLSISSRNEVNSIAKKNKLLQLLIYQLLVRNNYAGAAAAKAYIIPLATGGSKFLSAPDHPNAQLLLQEVVTQVIENMFNKDELLEHDLKSRFCDFCY